MYQKVNKGQRKSRVQASEPELQTACDRIALLAQKRLFAFQFSTRYLRKVAALEADWFPDHFPNKPKPEHDESIQPHESAHGEPGCQDAPVLKDDDMAEFH